jgi:hypothetical protein
MTYVDRLPRFARLEFLGKYQEPGRMIALGMVAGLLLFLGWWAFQPPLGIKAGADPDGVPGEGATAAVGDGDGVLDDITGAPRPGSAAVDRAQTMDAGESAELDALPEDGALEELPPDEFAPGDPDAPVDEGMVPDDAMPMPPVDGVALEAFYLEVERGPGVSEMLRIDATSPEQALQILRDYRGDPRVLNGPSRVPLQ